MKKAVLTAAVTTAILSLGSSCAKHSWEETQGLHEGMHKAHGDAGHEEHHAPAAGHEEKKAAH